MRELRSLETRSKERSSLEMRDTVREQVVVAERDTLREVTTITVQTNEKGDTISVSTITDRYRGRDSGQITVKSEKSKIVQDTMYVEKRDSVDVSTTNYTSNTNKKEGFWMRLRKTVKWLFALICAVIVLIVVIKCMVFRF